MPFPILFSLLHILTDGRLILLKTQLWSWLALIQNPSMAPHCLQDKEQIPKWVFERPSPVGTDLLV